MVPSQLPIRFTASVPSQASYPLTIAVRMLGSAVTLAETVGPRAKVEFAGICVAPESKHTVAIPVEENKSKAENTTSLLIIVLLQNQLGK
ncbi:hypothetical protein BGP_4769 [Beggiatoa sp. PS]|nr:hypothetical protein BGP_4769 [Beggiatoa sp. PS]